MHSHEHYRAAEALLDLAETEPEGSSLTSYYVDAAQVHATLAHVAVLAEASNSSQTGYPLVQRPSPASDGDPAYPGTPWGRALFGDLHLTKKED